MLSRMAQQILILGIEGLPQSVTPGTWGSLPSAVGFGTPLQSRPNLIHIRRSLLFCLTLGIIPSFFRYFRWAVMILSLIHI